MERGRVKWFESSKGYGFIKRASGEEIFVHFHEIDAENKILDRDQVVEFEVRDGPKGLHAVKVRPIEKERVD